MRGRESGVATLQIAGREGKGGKISRRRRKVAVCRRNSFFRKVFSRAMVKLKSFLIALAVIAGFSVIAGFIARGKPAPPKTEARETVLAVRATTAEIAARRPSILLVGEVEARDYAALTAPVEAEVLAVSFREGETFDKNARLLRLDLREQQLQARARRTELEGIGLQLRGLEQDRAADSERLRENQRLLELAERDYDRNLTLQAKNLVTRKQLETAEQTARLRRGELIELRRRVRNYDIEQRKLQAQQEAAEVALAQAQLLIERGELRAPFAGRVARVHTSVGARPGRGAQLLEIYNPESARLRAVAPGRHAAALLEGGTSAGVLQTGAESLSLSLSRVSPQASEGRGGVEVFFNLPPGEWVLGAAYEFSLHLPPVPETLSLPFDAVYDQSRVYVIDSESRARGEDCVRLGVERGDGETRALLRCPGAADGARIVATQLPGMAAGAKLRILQ